MTSKGTGPAWAAWFLIVGVAGNAAGAAAAPSERTLRQTHDGTVIGTEGAYDSYVWYGLPYGKPPVGELRWRAPRPSESWSQVRDATTLQKPCMQAVVYSKPPEYPEPRGSTIGSEDCLYLTVWSPRLTKSELADTAHRLPVMVWYHGGGNAFGHGGEYQGGHLAASQKVIVVTVNYRLNVFGWFNHRAFGGTGVSAEDASGNYGTLDQIQALKWVRANIAAFGGDAGKVTIFGESGGAADIKFLLHSPLAAGLFHRAIVQSAIEGPSFAPFADPARRHLDGDDFVTSLLITDGAAKDATQARAKAAAMPNGALANYLRGKSFEELRQAMFQARARLTDGNAGTHGPQTPAIKPDGTVLSAMWHNAVPIIIGNTLDEDRGFLLEDPKFVETVDGRKKILDRERFELLNEYLRKFTQAVASDETADNYVSRRSPTWVFRFDWKDYLSPDGQNYADLSGAAHATEVRMVFGTTTLGREMISRAPMFDQREGSSYRQLSDIMMSYWAQFAYTGDPGTGRDHNLPAWPRWTRSDARGKEAAAFMIFDAQSAGGTRPVSDQALTREMVFRQFSADPRLADPAIKCRLLGDMRAFFLTPLQHEEYHKLGADRCPPQS